MQPCGITTACCVCVCVTSIMLAQQIKMDLNNGVARQPGMPQRPKSKELAKEVTTPSRKRPK